MLCGAGVSRGQASLENRFGSDQCLCLITADRFGKEIALAELAVQRLDLRQLAYRFLPFGDIQVLGKHENGLDDLLVFSLVAHTPDKRAVDLEAVYWQPMQVPEPPFTGLPASVR